MGLFTKLFSSKEQTKKVKSYEKYGNVLKTLLTTKEQRGEAIDVLANQSPEDAIPQLLKRFEIVIESGLQDAREKERCFSIIVDFGDAAKPYIENAIKTQRRVSWLIKIAEKLFSYEEYVNLILANLNPQIAIFDSDSVERTEEMLLALQEADIKSDAIVEKVSQFFTSHDENVRMAALECLEAQAADNAKAKEIILDFAKEPLTDDNSRFLGIVQGIVKKHKWNEA